MNSSRAKFNHICDKITTELDAAEKGRMKYVKTIQTSPLASQTVYNNTTNE